MENEAKYEDTDSKDNISELTIIVSIKTGIVVSAIIIVMILGSLGIVGYVTISIMKKKQDIRDIGFLK